MKKQINIEVLLTIEKDGKALIDNRPALLAINDPSEQEWTHHWHIKDVQLPLTLEEVIAIYDKGTEAPEGRFDIICVERDRMKAYEGQAFISSIAYTGSLVTMQGASELKASA